MRNLFIIMVTIFSSISFVLNAQICTNGLVWNDNLGQCVSPETMPKKDANVQSCAPGLTWISFKNKCANEQEVRKVYDSLKIRYMREPMKKGNLTYVSTGTTLTVPVTESEKINIQKQQAEYLQRQQELDAREAQLKQQEQLANTQRTESANAEQMAQIKNVMAEMAEMKNQLNSLRAQVSNLTVQAMKAGSAPVNIGIGSSESLYKANIYGKTGEVQFNIECHSGYDWVAETQICLNSAANKTRILALAQNPNAKPTYTDRDVKCPRYFIWNGAMQNCKPTVSAIKQ